VSLDIIPLFKCDPTNGGGIEGILASIIRCGEKNGNSSTTGTHDYSKTELGLGITYPTLTRLYIHIYHAHL
jgi:hypothetical protein